MVPHSAWRPLATWALLPATLAVAFACSEAQETPFFDESAPGNGGTSMGGASGTGTGGSSTGGGVVGGGGGAGGAGIGGATGGGAGISGAAGDSGAAGSNVTGGTGSGGAGAGGMSGTDAGGTGGISVDCSGADPAAVAYENHCYVVRTTPVTWAAARDDCAEDDAHLVTFGSADRTEAEFLAENAFVWMLGGATEVWIGATDGRQSNQMGNNTPYMWITGEPLTFDRWSVNQPNNVQSACQANPAPCSCGEMCWEHCGFMWDPDDDEPGTWNDRHCEHLIGYVCEWDDPPM